MANIQVSSSPMVSVNVTSNINSYGVERHFDRSLTVAALKSKLELITGGSVQNMTLTVLNSDKKTICSLDNDEALLGSYPVDNDMFLHVEDPTLKQDEFLDVSKVEKFEMSQEAYAKRTDSVRAFKERNKLGKFNAEQRKKDEEAARLKEEEDEAKVKTMNIDDRCEVRAPGQPTRRGAVKYLGKADFKAGLWVGVRYDEPHGKNDGSVGGKRYFDCPPKYGGFLKPAFVEVGDFPEEDFELDEM